MDSSVIPSTRPPVHSISSCDLHSAPYQHPLPLPLTFSLSSLTSTDKATSAMTTTFTDKQLKSRKTYLKWTEAQEQALVLWYTERDESGVALNYRDFHNHNRLRAAERACETVEELKDKEPERVKAKLNNMEAAYKKARLWLQQTGQGVMSAGDESVAGTYSVPGPYFQAFG